MARARRTISLAAARRASAGPLRLARRTPRLQARAHAPRTHAHSLRHALMRRSGRTQQCRVVLSVPARPGQPHVDRQVEPAGPLSARQRGKCSERVSHGGCAGTHARASTGGAGICTDSQWITHRRRDAAQSRQDVAVCTPRTAGSGSTRASSREYSMALQRSAPAATAYSVWCCGYSEQPCHAMPCHAMPERVTSSRHHVRVSAGELTSSSKTSTVDSITFSRTQSGPNKRVWHSPQSTAPRTAQRKQTAERRRLIGASLRQ